MYILFNVGSPRRINGQQLHDIEDLVMYTILIVILLYNRENTFRYSNCMHNHQVLINSYEAIVATALQQDLRKGTVVSRNSHLSLVISRPPGNNKKMQMKCAEP
jgi:hypothetical protein